MALSTSNILQQYWGFTHFRPLQKEIIDTVLARKDCLALLPTGGGKSICYQVPALAQEGMCLVISPLVALMKDQVASLKKKGITAFAIYSGMKRKDILHTLQLAGNSNCKLLYVSPERLETNLFKEYLPSLSIHLIAVDEAHCIAQWGYDFRPSYLRIVAIREELPGVPILALTASATPEVQEDICQQLQFNQPAIFKQSFARPNISYSIFKPASKINKLVDILNRVPGSSIVYCRSRKKTKEIAQLLCTYQLSADYYHAGLPAEERDAKQSAWMNNTTRIMVCTNAFGMGIDKPDVRTVVHIDVPDCLENYYQEAGRAGRDRQKAYSVLLYDTAELNELEEQVTIRFPSLQTIQETYQAICNYLQLHVNSAEFVYHSFDLFDCIKKFELHPVTVIHTLKILEQENYMGFTDQVFIHSTIQFVCNKEQLYAFEKENSILEPLIKILLRSYEGIFDRPVNIYENQLAGWTKQEPTAIKTMLQQLHYYQIICYTPQKETPQVYLLQPRVKAEHLTINKVAYQKRKKNFMSRVAALRQYVENTFACRSQQMGRYFGDDNIIACGICDNCLQVKKEKLMAEEFKRITESVQTFLHKKNGVATADLLQHLQQFNKEKIWEVLQFLQTENKIYINAEGKVKAS
jgi:ATP-dependent DNA helicase RecQ